MIDSSDQHVHQQMVGPDVTQVHKRMMMIMMMIFHTYLI